MMNDRDWFSYKKLDDGGMEWSITTKAMLALVGVVVCLWLLVVLVVRLTIEILA